MNYLKRFWMFCLAPLVEDWRGLSLVRFLAIACFAFVAHTIWEEQRLSWTDAYVLTMGIATAFGKKVFVAWLQRTETKIQGVDATVRRFDVRKEPSPLDDESGR